MKNINILILMKLKNNILRKDRFLYESSKKINIRIKIFKNV